MAKDVVDCEFNAAVGAAGSMCWMGTGFAMDLRRLGAPLTGGGLIARDDE
jgi:hypothetical protein